MIQQLCSWAYIRRKPYIEKIYAPSVHCSTTHNSQDREAILISINRWVDKEDMAHIYAMEYYSAIERMK